MTILGLDHYNLRATGELMAALRAFYVDVVGLEEGARPAFASAGHWLYAGGRPVLHLSLADESEGRRVDARTTFDHAAFEARDRAAVEALLARRGITFRRSGVPGTPRVQVFFVDPAGNGVELNFPDADA